MPDNYSQWEEHERKKETWLARRPECADCGHNIQDEQAYYINGVFVCQDCMSSYLVDVEDYIE